VVPLVRIDLDDELASRLDARTALLTRANADSAAARAAWRAARDEKRGIRDHLVRMAPGVQRCMYCGDSLGTDIDHFEPIREFPAGTFVWRNHLLACSYCNSNAKRDLFPRDDAGSPLLIDPTGEDPATHLRLILRTGVYRPLTPRGTESIRVFGLNRPDLTRGREVAFATRAAVLCRADDLLAAGRAGDAARCLRALAEEPHASVLHEMLRTVTMPGAADVLGDDVLAALTNPALLRILRPAH
jgi:HNH endonuclease